MKRKKFSYHIARLIESSDKSGKDWDVVIIQAGTSLNNKIYKPSVLKKSLGLFEDAKVFAYEFKGESFNHLPDNIAQAVHGGFPKSWVGWLDHVKYGTFKDDGGQTQEGVLGKFHIIDGANWLRERLKDAFEHGKKTMLGFSIDGDGIVEEVIKFGKKLFEVVKINAIKSVDVVTHPAAGGQLRRLLASLDEGEVKMEWLKKLFEMAKKMKESVIEGIDSEKITEEQELKLIKFLIESKDFVLKDKISEQGPFVSDMVSRLIELISANKGEEAIRMLKELQSKMSENGFYGAPAVTPPVVTPPVVTPPVVTPPVVTPPVQASVDVKKELEEMQKIKKQLEEQRDLSRKQNCLLMLDRKLNESGLLPAVSEKVREQFKDKIFEENELDTIIVSEKKTLDKLAESGHVVGLGTNKIEIQKDATDKLIVAMDKMLGNDTDDKFKDVPAFTSIKECYRKFHPEDPTISGIIDTKSHFARLKENITTGDFTYALSVSMTKRAAKEFKVVPFPYEPFVVERGINDFKQQEVIKWGGFSTLPTVAERGTYGDLYEPKDERSVYTPGKKGGIVFVTRETIKNDDLRFIQRLPVKIGVAARRTRNRDVSTILTSNPTYTATNSAAYSTLFDNFSTAAVGYDSLRASKLRMKAQREKGAAQDAGTATSTTSTTLVDSTKAFTVDAFIGKYVRIVYGTGAGQEVAITDNDATSITVAAWETTPDTTSRYEISFASNRDEKIGLKAKYIIHGDDTEAAINVLLTSPLNPEAAEDANNEHFKTLISINSPYFDDTSQYFWVLAASKDQTETIEIGYIDNQREPTLLLQDQPTVGNVFTADEIRWKVRFEYGLTLIENRGFDVNEATTV